MDRPTSDLHPREELDFALTVSKAVDCDAHLLDQRQVQVRHRRIAGNPNVLPASDTASSAAGDQHWQIVMEMDIAVAHARTIENHDVVEQRSIAVLHRSKL